MKVLLIDDEEAIVEVFKQALSQDPSIEVFTALTGNDGINQTKMNHPDVIFLDQVLPDMNGNQALEMLKADPETKSIPIAILSNFNQDTLVQNAMKLGASDYILKYQIAPQDLRDKANKLLEEAQGIHTTFGEVPFNAPTTPIAAPVSEPDKTAA